MYVLVVAPANAAVVDILVVVAAAVVAAVDVGADVDVVLVVGTAFDSWSSIAIG